MRENNPIAFSFSLALGIALGAVAVNYAVDAIFAEPVRRRRR